MVAVGARRAGMVAVVLAGLTMGLAFAHTRELPQKLAYDAATWTQLQHSLYRYCAMVGGPLEGRRSSPLWCSRCGPVSVEQHLAGVGGWLLGAGASGQAANRCAMVPVAVSVNRWALGRAWPRLGSSPEIPSR